MRRRITPASATSPEPTKNIEAGSGVGAAWRSNVKSYELLKRVGAEKGLAETPVATSKKYVPLGKRRLFSKTPGRSLKTWVKNLPPRPKLGSKKERDAEPDPPLAAVQLPRNL